MDNYNLTSTEGSNLTLSTLAIDVFVECTLED